MTDARSRQATDLPPADLLASVRVLDLTNVLSGPYCTYQMAMLGAEIIKVENPDGGDLARQLGASPDLNKHMLGTSFLAQNAGKKSVSLNLKSPEGAALFRQMVQTADVVVENFRPGVMQRLGLGYDELSEINPAIIYCAISGFGQEGPLRGNPAYDQIVQGMSGVMSITGDKDSAPLRVGYPLCDTLGGLSAAFAVVSALYARKESGKGRFIDVSMLDSTLSALGWAVSNYLLAGVEPRPIGNQNMTAAPSGVFTAADGPLNIAANKQEQFETLCRLIQREHLLSDPRFAGREDRKLNRDALNAEIDAALLGRTAAEWETLLNEAGVPSGRVLTIPEVLASEQVRSRRLVQELPYEHGGLDSIRVVRGGYRLGDSEPGARCAPPLLGEHNAQIYAEIGLDAEAIAALKDRRIV
ncbi:MULTISPECIES: CaiB/BaiF CoA-transferase family protein [unclassified Novosphingobium]|uniref:CaiB/BaiF CoA transferase family protein n=1 Tax=unclassified Novosphingobium TaxID=2644732 RepID=UPI00135CC95D|nr:MULTISPECIES: CoA transferase [unclassified Novosphingobium]